MQRAQQCAGDAEHCAAERLCSGGVAGSSIPGSRLAAPLDSPLHNIAARPRHSFTGLPVSIMCWRGSRAPEITWGQSVIRLEQWGRCLGRAVLASH